MKKTFFFMAVALLTLFSCGQSKETEEQSVEAAIDEEAVAEEQSVEAAVYNAEDLPRDVKSTMGDTIIQLPETIAAANILRIEENVDVNWSGVSGCSKKSTVNRNIKKSFEAWVGKKVLQHPNMMVINYGYPAGKVSTSSRKEPWPDSRRSCRGSVTLKFYIEFYRP